jgi:nucleoside-diphosphate-sugar epimerase
MNVLIIGATRYLGTAVDQALKARGCRTYGTARNESALHVLVARGTDAVRCDLSKPQSLVEAARSCDAVVYVPRTMESDASPDDNRLIRTLGTALAGTEKTFIYTSSTWVYGHTNGVVDEDTEVVARPFARRLDLERLTLSMTSIGIRSLVIRAGIAYGHGSGIPQMLNQSARERGAASIVGDGTNRWATIHVDDFGELVATVLERGRPGRTYNAVGDYAFTVRELAEAASRGAGAGGATTIVHPELLGDFGECLALDQLVLAERARAIGWKPEGPSLLEELENGSYVAEQQVAAC